MPAEWLLLDADEAGTEPVARPSVCEYPIARVSVVLCPAADVADAALNSCKRRVRICEKKSDLRRASCRSIFISVQEDLVNDVRDTVAQDDVGLNDARCDGAQLDVLASRVDREGEFLTCGRGVFLTDELRRIYGSAIDDLRRDVSFAVSDERNDIRDCQG